MKESIFFTEENKEKEKRTKTEIKEIREQLKAIIITVSGKPIEVTTEVDARTLASMACEGRDANNEWFRQTQHDPRTKKPTGELVHIPPKVFEASENIAKGKAAHEGGHVAITRMGEFVPDEVSQELGFHSVMLAAEERSTDQVVRDRYPGAGEWVDEARKDNVIGALEVEKSGAKLGYIPKFSQICDLIVHEPHYEEIPSYYDPEVLKLYEKIKEDVVAVEHALPSEGVYEEEILEKAKDRYRIVYTKIWKEVKNLVKEDLSKEEIRQMILQNNQKEEDEMLEKLEEALRDELKSVIDKISADEEGAPVPMDEFSKELLNALGEILDVLPKKKQGKIKEEAKEVLEDMEDDLVGKMSGELLENPTETHKEHKEKKEKETKEKKEKQEIEKEKKEIERKEAAFRENSSVYDKAYSEIRQFDDELFSRLEEIFQPNIKRNVRLKSSGSRINLGALFKWEAGRKAGAVSLDNRIFESVHLPEKKDYVFTLLVDLSGSMNGEKITETFKAVVLLSEVLNRLGMKFQVLGFQDEVINFKDFNKEFSDDGRNRMSGMLAEVSNQNPGGHNKSSYNDDGPCLLEASSDLEKQSGKKKFLIVFSDGQPSGRRSNAEDLHKAVSLILEKTDQKLVALGLGRGTEHVKNFYPNSIPDITVSKLPEVLGGLLEDIIRNPGRYKNLEART